MKTLPLRELSIELSNEEGILTGEEIGLKKSKKGKGF
jgi:hypothetical protein